MKEKVILYYFSPTGGTKKVGMIFSKAFAGSVDEVNLGAKGCKTCAEEVKAGTDCNIIVAAAPVFGGRIPHIVSEKLGELCGKGKKAVTLAVYGNRAYEDALLEMNDVLTGSGFEVIASGAFIAQHSMVPFVGAGRPDMTDTEEIEAFARAVSEKLDSCAVNCKIRSEVPGNHPYKDPMTIPATPISGESCTACGSCVRICPTDAISISEGKIQTDISKCMLCMACTAACPTHARILSPSVQAAMNDKLGALKAVRTKNEWFL